MAGISHSEIHPSNRSRLLACHLKLAARYGEGFKFSIMRFVRRISNEGLGTGKFSVEGSESSCRVKPVDGSGLDQNRLPSQDSVRPRKAGLARVPTSHSEVSSAAHLGCRAKPAIQTHGRWSKGYRPYCDFGRYLPHSSNGRGLHITIKGGSKQQMKRVRLPPKHVESR